MSFLVFFAWNMGMSFFIVCPFIFLVFAPKIGMNRTEIILSSSSCNSSRFSGPFTHSYLKAYHKKRHPHVPHMDRFSAKGHDTKKVISMLRKRFLSPMTMKRSAGVI
jgi:hypothetical protein